MKTEGHYIFYIEYPDKIVNKEDIMPNNEIIPPDRLARVGVGCSLTLNLGNFQSARVLIYVELPGDKDKLDEIHQQAMNFAQKKLTEEVQKIVDWRDQVLKGQPPDFPEP